MRGKVSAVIWSVALLLGGCGTSSTDDSLKNAAAEEHEWKTLKTVSGHEIIAELEQTVEVSERENSIQTKEGPTVISTLDDIYGENGFRHEGIIFYGDEDYGKEQTGIWVGVKNPDERMKEMLTILQSKVDAGEILAEPIYIFRSPHTEKELHDLQDEVARVVNGMRIDRGFSVVSVDIITGEFTIRHDHLKAEHQEELRKIFSDTTIYFEQNGSMVAEPGESSIIWSKQASTEMPVDDGGFIFSIDEGKIFVVGGNQGEVIYEFPEADQLKVGQRVKVEPSGGIKLSLPGKGEAKFVEVMPDYKPVGAKLSESQVVAKAIEQYDGGKSISDYLTIKGIAFDDVENKWIVETLQDEEKVLMEIKDH